MEYCLERLIVQDSMHHTGTKTGTIQRRTARSNTWNAVGVGDYCLDIASDSQLGIHLVRSVELWLLAIPKANCQKKEMAHYVDCPSGHQSEQHWNTQVDSKVDIHFVMHVTHLQNHCLEEHKAIYPWARRLEHLIARDSLPHSEYYSEYYPEFQQDIERKPRIENLTVLIQKIR